jgi:hypothetical protein
MDSSTVGGYAMADSWGSLNKRYVLHSKVPTEDLRRVFSISDETKSLIISALINS